MGKRGLSIDVDEDSVESQWNLSNSESNSDNDNNIPSLITLSPLIRLSFTSQRLLYSLLSSSIRGLNQRLHAPLSLSLPLHSLPRGVAVSSLRILRAS